MTQVGIPYPQILLPLSIGLQFLFSALILLGFFTRLSSLFLIFFLAGATFFYHDFWQYTGTEFSEQLEAFLGRLLMIGGYLLLLSFGPGKWSLDALFAKNQPL